MTAKEIIKKYKLRPNYRTIANNKDQNFDMRPSFPVVIYKSETINGEFTFIHDQLYEIESKPYKIPIFPDNFRIF